MTGDYEVTVLKNRIALLSDQLAEARKDTALLDRAEALLAAGHSIFQGQVVHRGPLIASPTLRAALAACPEPGGQDG